MKDIKIGADTYDNLGKQLAPEETSLGGFKVELIFATRGRAERFVKALELAAKTNPRYSFTSTYFQQAALIIRRSLTKDRRHRKKESQNASEGGAQ